MRDRQSFLTGLTVLTVRYTQEARLPKKTNAMLEPKLTKKSSIITRRFYDTRSRPIPRVYKPS